MSELRGRRAFVVEGEYILVPPDGVASAPVVLLLHGFGDSAPLLAERLSDLRVPRAALLFAGGPIPVEREEAVPGGERRRRIGQCWYCYDGDQDRFRDALEDVEAYLESLLEEVRKRAGVDPTRLVVAGYSMGAYVAGFFGLRRKPRPLGVALLAGRLKHEFLASEIARTDGLPVLLGQGEADERFPRLAADEGRGLLEAAGARVTALTHAGGHGLTAEMIAGFQSWLSGVLGG